MTSSTYEAIGRAKEEAQTVLDQQQLSFLDKVQACEALGALNISLEELYDWFIATRCLNGIDTARASGWASIDYIALDDIPEASRCMDTVQVAQMLKGLEPKRKGKKALGRQAIDGSIGLLRLGEQLPLGVPYIEMLEYEAAPESYHRLTGDQLYRTLATFVSDWDAFLYDHWDAPETP